MIREVPSRPMYRFATTPRWMLMHAIVLIVVSLFAVAGSWQLRRLDERRERNALIEERQRMPIVRGLTSDGVDTADLAFRRARLSGRYDAEQQIVLAGRPDPDGRPGDHLLTPLVSDDDASIVVDRGWVPIDTPRTVLEPAGGQVIVEGILVPSEGRAPLTSGQGRTARTTRIDLGRFSEQVPYRLAGVYLLLHEQQPPSPDEVPVPGALPEPSEGSHLAYAVQWFLFIPTALVVYAALLRQRARRLAHRLASGES